MELSRLISGNVPFVTNVLVYKASTLDQGAVICATANTASLQGAIISVTTNTSACDNAVGVTMISSSRASASKENSAPNATWMNIGSDGYPDATTTTGCQYLPACINTDALYFAQYSVQTGATSTGDAKSVGITASAGTSVVLGSSGVDHCGGWLYTDATTNTAGNTPTFHGGLRWVAHTAASDTYGLTTAMNISADCTVLIVSQPLRKLTTISSGGNYLRSHGCGTVGKVAQAMLILDNYMIHDQAPMHPLRFNVDDGLDGLSGSRLYSEIGLTDMYWVNG